MPDYSFSPDLSFLNKKIKLGFRAQRRGNWRAEEQSTNAQVANAGDIIHVLTPPIHPNVAHGLDARSHPSGIFLLCQCGCHVSPSVPAGLGRAAEKTNDPTQSVANNSWRIGSEPSGKDRNCCAGFSSLPAGFTRRGQIQFCSQASEMAPSAPGQIHGRTKSVVPHSSMLVPMPAALTGRKRPNNPNVRVTGAKRREV
jgi:hypothetical protein